MSEFKPKRCNNDRSDNAMIMLFNLLLCYMGLRDMNVNDSSQLPIFFYSVEYLSDYYPSQSLFLPSIYTNLLSRFPADF